MNVRSQSRVLHRWVGMLGLIALLLAACTAPGQSDNDVGDGDADHGVGDDAGDEADESADGTADDATTDDATDPGATDPAPTQEPTLAWGPAEADLARATEIAEEMDDEELAGQVIIARYSGTDPATAAALVETHHLAGVILFSENIASVDQVRQSAQAVQDAHAASGRPWPAVVSVDNEGGSVQRMSAQSGGWTSFPPFAAAGAADDHQVVSGAAQAMGIELRASGVNTTYAPVADVSIGAQDPTINMRAAGSDSQVVSRTVTSALEGFADAGVLSALKHFPGHGALRVDSHEELPVLSATEAELAERDLLPFQAGIEAGAPMVMMGHIAVQDWDEGVPASLSARAYEVLRADLGFTGVAITDGLDMGALTATRTSGQIAQEALAAGADLLLTPADVAGAHEAIVVALADGSLDRGRVVEAAGRVIAMQHWQGELAERGEEVDDEDVGSGGAAAHALAAAAITLVAGECSGSLVGERVHLSGGSEADVAAFTEAAATGGLTMVPAPEQAETSVRLIAAGGTAAGGDVAIALDGPWHLAGADAPTRIAAHGRTSHTMAALVEVLTGQAEAPGRLGFQVDGLPASACP